MNPGRVGSGGAEKDHWGRQHHHHHQCSIGKNGSGGAGVLERRPSSSPPPGGRKSAPSSIAPSEAPLNLERGGEHRRAPVQRFFSLSSKPSLPDRFFHPRHPRGREPDAQAVRWTSVEILTRKSRRAVRHAGSFSVQSTVWTSDQEREPIETRTSVAKPCSARRTAPPWCLPHLPTHSPNSARTGVCWMLRGATPHLALKNKPTVGRVYVMEYF